MTFTIHYSYHSDLHAYGSAPRTQNSTTAKSIVGGKARTEDMELETPQKKIIRRMQINQDQRGR